MYVSKSLHKLDDSRDRHKMRWQRHWSSDVCSSDLLREVAKVAVSSPEHVHTVADADGGDPGIVHLCADDPVGAEQPTEDVRMGARLREEHHMRQALQVRHSRKSDAALGRRAVATGVCHDGQELEPGGPGHGLTTPGPSQ